jgi:hypothetical protein
MADACRVIDDDGRFMDDAGRFMDNAGRLEVQSSHKKLLRENHYKWHESLQLLSKWLEHQQANNKQTNKRTTNTHAGAPAKKPAKHMLHAFERAHSSDLVHARTQSDFCDVRLCSQSTRGFERAFEHAHIRTCRNHQHKH